MMRDYIVEGLKVASLFAVLYVVAVFVFSM